MKKIVSTLLCAVLLLAALSVLSACGNARYDGTYYLYAGEWTDKEDFLKLSGGKWTMRLSGETMLGTYEISDGRITLSHTVDRRETLDRMLLGPSAADGERAEVFGGRVEDGAIYLDTQMGEQRMDVAFYLEEQLPQIEPPKPKVHLPLPADRGHYTAIPLF